MPETYAARIAKGSAYLVTQSIVNTVISAVAFAFIARILTQEEMGITVVLTLTLTVAQLLSDLGFSGGLAKYIAEYRGRNADYSPMMFSGVLIKALMTGFIAILCAVGARQLSQAFLNSDEYTILFQLLSIRIFFNCINITINSCLLGLNKIREMAIFNVVSIFTAQITAVTLLMYGYGLVGLLTGWVLGDLAYIIVSAPVIVKGKHFRKHSTREVSTCLRLLARFSWPLFLTNMIVFVYNWFDQAVLLAYVPLGEVAVYSVALRAFSVLYLIPGALSTTLLPYYSEQYGRDRQENIMVGVRASTRYISLLYTPLALGLTITANHAIALFAGPIYARGGAILAILSLLGGISSISAALGTLLLVYNMTPTVLLINIASIAVSMALSPISLPSLGATGMAIIKGTSLIMSLVFTTVALRRHLPIQFDKEAIWKSWSAAIVMFVAVGLIELTCFNMYLLPIYILVGGMVYVIALRILKTIHSNDIQLIRDLIGPRGTRIGSILEKIFM